MLLFERIQPVSLTATTHGVEVDTYESLLYGVGLVEVGRD